MSLISARKAAEYLGISRSVLQATRFEGKNVPYIPTVNAGAIIFYDTEELKKAQEAINAYMSASKARKSSKQRIVWQSRTQAEREAIALKGQSESTTNCGIYVCNWDTCEMKSYRQCEKPKEVVNESKTRQDC